MPNIKKAEEGAERGLLPHWPLLLYCMQTTACNLHWYCELIRTLGEEVGVHVQNARKGRMCWVVLQSRQQLGCTTDK